MRPEDASRVARFATGQLPVPVVAMGSLWLRLRCLYPEGRLAQRRYIDNPLARPPWWTAYRLPPELAALEPVPDSRFLTGDGKGGRASGGLFSLDGLHPTTVGYGLMAQELIQVMRRAAVAFRYPDGMTPRGDPVTVDFNRLSFCRRCCSVPEEAAVFLRPCSARTTPTRVTPHG